MTIVSTAKERPNIIYIDCHDLGEWLGCYGKPYLRTPNLDRLASEGARFTQFIASAPICMPSRAGIYTGKMPHVAGVMGQEPLNGDAFCMAEHFRRGGYETVLAGSLMILNDPAWAGFEKVLADGPPEEAAADFMLERGSNNPPFFLSLSLPLVHRPFGDAFDPLVAERLEVPPPLPDLPAVRKDLAALCRQVEELDVRVGKVLNAIKEAGLEQTTLVVFTTEHGLATARAKHTLFDAGLKCALLIKYPPLIRAGKRYDPLLSNLDLLPTLLETANLPVPDDIQGRSFLSLLEGQDDYIRQEAFSEHTWGRRTGRWYYTPMRSVRTERYKYIHNFTRQPNYLDNAWLARFDDPHEVANRLFSSPTPEAQLYDLQRDPHELTNLASHVEFAEVRDELKKRLFGFLEHTDDPILRGPVPNHENKPDVPEWTETSEGGFRLRDDEPIESGEAPFP